MTPGACAWGPEDALCGAPTYSADSLCPFHREHLDEEKRTYPQGDSGLTLHFDATGHRPIIRFMTKGESL